METASSRPVTPIFVALFILAATGLAVAVMAPVVVTLALKVDGLVGPDDRDGALGLVVGVGALFALLANPVWGRLSDRTASRFGMRRPYMVLGAVGGLVTAAIMAAAPNVPILLLGFCLSQVVLNAAFAALMSVLPDQVPVEQRGIVSGLLGISLPVGLVGATFLVQLVSHDEALMFLLPAAVAFVPILAFATFFTDRRLEPEHKPPWSTQDLLSTFYVNPRAEPDFGWAWLSRFLIVLAYAFLTTYLAFYLMSQLGTATDDVARQVFLGMLVLAGATVVSSLSGGWLSDRAGQRKIFVLLSAGVLGVALFIVATATSLSGFLVAMAVAGVGLGVYTAVDLALVADVLPNPDDVAKDMGVFNIANALPQSLAPAIAPAVLAVSGGSYAVLYAVAAGIAVLSAVSIMPVRKVR